MSNLVVGKLTELFYFGLVIECFLVIIEVILSSQQFIMLLFFHLVVKFGYSSIGVISINHCSRIHIFSMLWLLHLVQHKILSNNLLPLVLYLIALTLILSVLLLLKQQHCIPFIITAVSLRKLTVILRLLFKVNILLLFQSQRRPRIMGLLHWRSC